MADLQKTLPTTDLNKKKLSFDKISPRDFHFFSFLFNLYLFDNSLEPNKDKSLSESMIIYFTGAYLHHPASMR